MGSRGVWLDASFVIMLPEYRSNRFCYFWCDLPAPASRINRAGQRKMRSGMDSTTAYTEIETHDDGSALLASQTVISRHEGRGIRSVAIAGEAGQLEAILNEGTRDAKFAALVCHPHPLGGGNLHNKVVYHAMKVLNDAAWGLGWPVLRFNFRGTGLSEGAHDGEAETGDVLAGMDWLEREFRLPLIVAGFSFGAAMALRACCLPGTTHRDVRALIALGLPTTAQGPAYQLFLPAKPDHPKTFSQRRSRPVRARRAIDASGRFCGRTQAPHPYSRRRPFLYRSTGSDATALLPAG